MNCERIADLPTGVGRYGVDTNDDQTPDATFKIPDSLTDLLVYMQQITPTVPFIFAHFENGDTVRIDKEP